MLEYAKLTEEELRESLKAEVKRRLELLSRRRILRAALSHNLIVIALILAGIVFATGGGFLGVVVDMFSRRIVGWSMRDDLKADLVVDALAMAVTRRRPPAGLVHHSDRGSQYTSLAFGRTLRESGLVASMGSRGDAYDNAACESVISTLKVEWIKRHRYGGCRSSATSRRSTNGGSAGSSFGQVARGKG